MKLEDENKEAIMFNFLKKLFSQPKIEKGYKIMKKIVHVSYKAEYNNKML